MGAERDAAGDRPPVDPRFSLASERTFLAWSRTALALVAAGLAVTHLVDVDSPVGRRLVGVPLVVAGAVVAGLAYRRRMLIERALVEGDELPPTRLPALLTVALILAAAGAVVLAVID